MAPTTAPRTARPVRLAALAVAGIGAAALLLPLPPRSAAAEGIERPTPPVTEVVLPHDDVARPLPHADGDPGPGERVVLGDMVVTLLPGQDGHGHHAGTYEAAGLEGGGTEAAAGGYTPFSPTARLLPSGYAIRLTGPDARIEGFRPEIAAAARAASAATGVPLTVVGGMGGPVEPARGEIVVVLAAGPCGEAAAGCGGPALTPAEVQSGRVWIAPASLGLGPALRANLAAHELGHALGLRHHEADWTDGRQVMHPRLHGTTTYRAGDTAGLRWLAGTDDRPAGAIGAVTYAAGRVHVAGTLQRGSTVRLSSGSVVADVAGAGGRFDGALPLPAGRHPVCARVLDAGPGRGADLGCTTVDAPGAPFGRLDGAEAVGTGIRVSGWAADPQTADAVQVEVRTGRGVAVRATADRSREDLGEAAHRYGDRHGFDVEVPAAPGADRVCVVVLGVGAGGDLDLGCRDVHVEPAPPAPPTSAPDLRSTTAVVSRTISTATATSAGAIGGAVGAVSAVLGLSR